MLLTKPKTGSVLVAEPSIIGDVSFQRSVVLIADHSDKGSIGFILNKPLTYTLADVIPNITQEFRIFNGGPVEQDSLYFVHKVPHLIPNSVEISSGIFWGGDFSIVSDLIATGKISPDDIKFFLGYSGWSTDQLYDEMTSNSWVIVNSDLGEMISRPTEDFWRNIMLKLGGDYPLWANAPENPSYN